MERVEAIVIKNRGKCEVRCGKCGKLLFICKNLSESFDNRVDKSSQNGIIVARCPRNDCKSDNLFCLP